jgi:hypothetical protein
LKGAITHKMALLLTHNLTCVPADTWMEHNVVAAESSGRDANTLTLWQVGGAHLYTLCHKNQVPEVFQVPHRK